MKKSVYIDNGVRWIQVNAEIVSSPAQMSQGLQYRQHLSRSDGMLFDFKAEGMHRMTMSKVLIPLDMIFISNGRIAEMKECPVGEYNVEPSVPCTQVLEVNNRFCKDNILKVGQRVRL